MHNAKIAVRLIGLLTATVFVASTMVGCVFGNNLSPADLGVQGDSAELAFCKGGVVEYILVEQRAANPGSSAGWEEVWEGSGRLVARSGDRFVLGDSVVGLDANVLGSLNADEGTKYAVTIVFKPARDGDSPTEFGPMFIAPSGGFEEGSWLDYSGQSSPDPCD